MSMRKYLIAIVVLTILNACGNKESRGNQESSYDKHVDSIVVTPQRANQIIDSVLKR